MKVLKKILLGLLTFLFFNLVTLCILSYAADRYLQKELVSDLIKEVLTTTVVQMTDLTEEQEQQVQEIFEQPAAQELIEDLNEELLNGMNLDGNIEIDPEMFDKVFDYILENKEQIESITNSEINLSEIEEFRNSDDYQNIKENMTENINNSMSQSNDNQKTVEKVFNYYSVFISNKFRMYVIGLSIINLICIALLQNSNYKWLKTFGKAIIMCGITLTCFYAAMVIALKVIESKTGVSMMLDYKSLIVFDIIFIGIGIFSLIVYKNIKKNVEKMNE